MKGPFSPSDLLNYVSIASINAKGNLAACVVSQPDESADTNTSKIWLVPLDGQRPTLFTGGTDSVPRWSPKGEELAFVSNRNDSGLQIFVIRADGGEAQQVTTMKSGVQSVVWSPDGKKLLFTATQDVDPSARGERTGPAETKSPHVVWRLPYKTDGIGYTLDREIHLFVIEREGGNAIQLTDGPFDVRSAEFSPDGSRIALTRTRVGREAHRTDVWIMDADGKNPKELTSDVASVQGPVWSPDGLWIAFSGSAKEGDSRSRLWLIDTSDNSLHPLGDEALEIEQGGSLHWSDKSDALFFIQVRNGLQEIATMRISDQKLDVLVSGERHILKFALAPDKLVYAAASVQEAAEVFVAARDGSSEKSLTEFNAWWMERLPPATSLRSFVVPDGKGGSEEVEGWLMLPSNGASPPFPLLIDVHGGPQSVAYVDYGKTVWRHVLCSRGWAVLALNPVGSSSYGLEFMTRLKNKWGELDLPQQLAAIKTLQDEGIADDRVAMYGKSYGGYLSAWAITQTNVFKAAVVSAPVSNIESHFGTSDSGFYVTPYAMCGEPYVDRTAARKLSPLDHMHKARTPTLLLQGTDDQRCPVGQSEEIFATLMRSSDVAVEMILYPGADHHLAEEGSPAFRIDYVSRLVDWVEKWVNQGGQERQTNPENSTQSSSGGGKAS